MNLIRIHKVCPAWRALGRKAPDYLHASHGVAATSPTCLSRRQDRVELALTLLQWTTQLSGLLN